MLRSRMGMFKLEQGGPVEHHSREPCGCGKLFNHEDTKTLSYKLNFVSWCLCG